MKYGYECYICGNNFDAGELRNGKCEECREAEIQASRKSAHLEKKWDRLVIKTKGQLQLAIGGSQTNG